MRIYRLPVSAGVSIEEAIFIFMSPPSSSRFTLDPLHPLATRVFIGCMAVFCLLTATIVSVMPISRVPVPESGAANLARLGVFWIIAGQCWLALTGLWWMLRKAGGEDLPVGMGRRNATLLIFLVAVAARLIVLLGHDPALSDDVYRYVFDGRNMAAGVNPYLASPQERMGILEGGGMEHFPGEGELLPRINNPELPTIYLPMSQWVFGLAGWVIPGSVHDADSAALVFRGYFVLLELGMMGLLAWGLARAGKSAWWLALYAWHPLPLTEIAGSGHQDVVGVGLLVLALVLARKGAKSAWGWTSGLAAAMLVKPFVLPLALVFLRGKPIKQWVGSLCIGVGVCAVLVGPILFSHQGEPLRNLAATGSRFSLKWAHFGSVYEPVLWGIEQVTNEPEAANLHPEDASLWTNDAQEQLARLVCLGLVLGVVVITVIRVRDPWVAARVILFSMVLFSPTAHPWYLLWALAMFPRAPSPALWIFSFTILLGYAQLGDVVEWHTPGWAMVVAYVPVYGALMVDLLRKRKGTE